MHWLFLTTAPPTPECESIPLVRPILSSRHILFQLISINICVWAFSTPLTHTYTYRQADRQTCTLTLTHTLLSGTPRPSSMQMLIRNWCIAGGFKVMASRGGTFPIKYANPHWLCSFCSTMCLELLLEAKTVCRKHTSSTEINRRGWEQFRVNEIWSHLETSADPGSNWIHTCEVKYKWDERYKKLSGNFRHFCFAARTSTADDLRCYISDLAWSIWSDKLL